MISRYHWNGVDRKITKRDTLIIEDFEDGRTRNNRKKNRSENRIYRFSLEVQLENSSERMCDFLGTSADNFYHGSRSTNSTDKTLCSGIPACNSCLSSVYENNAFPSQQVS